ncbi:12554_t:CDS:1, partial [Gigaspora margarita]
TFYYVPPTPPNPRPNQRTSNSNRQRRNRRNRYDDLDYDPEEDDDYNVDSGQSWKNISGEKLEWEEENDYNEYINPGERGEMLDQKYN